LDFAATDRKLRALRPKPAAYSVTLGEGLLCRVAPNGLKTIELRARLFNTVRRYPLGHYPAMTITEAVEKASSYRALLKSGIDPKIQERRAQGNDTPRFVKDAAERFIQAHLKDSGSVRQRWATEAERIIRVELLPKIGGYPLAQLKRSDLTSIVENKARALRAAGFKGVGANRVGAVISKMFGWIASQGWMVEGIAAKLPRPTKETPKERVLTAEEAGEFWLLLDECTAGSGPISATQARILKLLALTGCRISEITSLTLDRIDMKHARFRIEGGKTRASNRTLPLTPTALAVIEEQLAQLPDRTGVAVVFPSPRAGVQIASNEVSHNTDRLLAHLNHTPRWTAHDLRRTLTSVLADRGVDGDTRRLIVGHKAPDIHAAVYDKAARVEQMREALLIAEGWYRAAADENAERAHGGNVIVMRAGREDTSR
jgi:integrase